MRIALAITLDGKIARFKGEKSQLGNLGDRKLLEEALEWADATLMGGETLRIHKTTCLIHNKDLIDKRIKENKSPQPISIIISDKNKSSVDFPFFTQPIIRWLITNKKNSNTINNNKVYERIIIFGESWSETLLNLSKNGISKLLVLGGSKLIGSLLLEDKINELQLTITPKLIGGDLLWIPSEIDKLPEVLSKSDSWILKENKSIGKNEILLRYNRNQISKN